MMFCVVDQHAITIPQDPAILRENIRVMTASLLACGLILRAVSYSSSPPCLLTLSCAGC